MTQPIEAGLIAAGEIDLAPDRDGDEPGTVSRAVVVQFDTADDLKRAMAGEPVVMRWHFDREPAGAEQRELFEI